MRLPLLSPPRSQLPTASILRQGRLSITFPKRTAQPSPRCKQQQQQQRRALLSTTTMCAASESPESRFDPPTGNLFGVPPGEKYQKEGWENLWVYGFWGSLLLATVAYCFKPDTSYVSIFLVVDYYFLDYHNYYLGSNPSLVVDDIFSPFLPLPLFRSLFHSQWV